MWVRIGKRNRWNAAATSAENIALDLRPRENEDTSVYRVENVEEGLRVAAAHAVTQRDGEDNIDVIVLPDEALPSVLPQHRPSEDLPRYLSDRHYEVPGLDDQTILKRVSEAAYRELQAGHVHVARLRPREIAATYGSGLRDEPGIRAATRWQSLNDEE